MNLESLRRLQSKLSVAFVAATALVLTSCGGGGATSSPNNSGDLQLLPGSGSIYAGVPYKANIAGGRKPYLVTSSEPTLIDLNFTTDSNEFTFVARNPGVVDVGLDPNEVPRRSVNIAVRDSNGQSTLNTFNVLQNFFTGYREFYSNTCAFPVGGTAPQACSGNDSIVTLIPVSNGALYGNRELQLDKVRGDFGFVVENSAANAPLVDQIRVRTDQTGRAIVRLRVSNNAPTQLATYKVTDLATGVTTDVVFLIVGTAVDAITLVPSSLSFTGSLTTDCGSGAADIFVFGGTPPYTVTASSILTVTPTTVATFGGRFTVTTSLSAPPCPGGATVIVTDSRGRVATLAVTILPGTRTLPPAPPLVVVPGSVPSLLCGQSAQLSAAGGAGGLSVTSTHPRIRGTASGNTITLTRLTGDGATIFPTEGSVGITDGTTALTVTITATPANCP